MLLDNTNKHRLIINEISSLYQTGKIDSETKNQLADLAYKGFQDADYKDLYNFTINKSIECLYPIQEIVLLVELKGENKK